MSRTRRAISCVYCPPKSTTAILSVGGPSRGPPNSRAKGATPPSHSPGPGCSSRPGESGALLGVLVATLLLPRASELLGLLEDLAFGLDRGSDDQLRLLQFADVARAHRAHAGPDRAHEVQGAVLGEGRAEEDLFERPRDAHANAGAARQVHVRRGHPPVIAASRRLDRARE